jgi:DinB family protein
MPTLEATVATGFSRRYAELAERVRELAAPLTDEQFWRKPYPYGNSFAHLVLHLTGNLSYYIGAEIGNTGYVRNRDREFSETERPPKQEVMRRFDAAVEVVQKTIGAQRADDWGRDYSALREEDALDRFGIFLRCATHLHLHIGQMIFLCYELGREG